MSSRGKTEGKQDGQEGGGFRLENRVKRAAVQWEKVYRITVFVGEGIKRRI